MNSIYPVFDDSEDLPLYYVEFDRGSILSSEKLGTFTLFQRQLLRSKKDCGESPFMLMCREGHPWNILDGRWVEGGMPDKNWVRWMVDQLNKGCDVCQS